MASRRKGTTVVIALATLGAAIAWLLTMESRDPADTQHPPSALEDPTRQTITAPTVTPIVGIGNTSVERDVPEPSDVPIAEGTTGVTLAELEKEYGDPTLARDAKLVIQRVLDTKLDRSRYEVHAIICHEQNCQIFSNPVVSGADSDWPPIVDAITQQLGAASFRSAETGAVLKPELKAISRGRRAGAVTVTIIWLR